MYYTIEYKEYGQLRYRSAEAAELTAVLTGITDAGHKILRVRAHVIAPPTHSQSRLF
jgi:hypothetical protein